MTLQRMMGLDLQRLGGDGEVEGTFSTAWSECGCRENDLISTLITNFYHNMYQTVYLLFLEILENVMMI